MKWRDLQRPQKNLTLRYLVFLIIFCVAYLGGTTAILVKDRVSEDSYWESHLQMEEELQQKVDAVSTSATPVTTGIYMENLKEVSLNQSYFRGVYHIWFRWQGDESLDMANAFQVYRGTVNSKEIIKDYHKDGENYQLIRCDITVSKTFWTRRFPLESHQLRMYLECDYAANEVVFVNDREESGYNENLNISNYDIKRFDTGVYANVYDSPRGDPEFTDDVVTSEIMMQLEINREGFGLYIKCFMALVGTLTWVMISLYICTYHRINPLNLIPAALFGTVTNIMVGANLLPEALQTGLLEFENLWGVFTILGATICIIRINRIRDKHSDNEFAKYFGKRMFFCILFFLLLGNIILPISAYMW